LIDSSSNPGFQRNLLKTKMILNLLRNTLSSRSGILAKIDIRKRLPNIPRQFRHGLGYGSGKTVIVWCLVALLSTMQYLSVVDSLFYHALLKLTPATVRAPQVLMVSMPYADSGGDTSGNSVGNSGDNISTPPSALSAPDWAPLVKHWLAGGASRVAFGFALNTAQQASLAPLVQAGRVVLAAPSGADQLTSSENQRQAWWSVAAGRSGQTIWPDYSFPVSLLPAITLQRAQSEGIIGPMLKVIVLGYAAAPALRQISIPGQTQTASQLQMDALQIDSLLQNGRIRHGNWLSRMLAAGCFAAFMLLALQRPSFQFGLFLLGSSIGLSFAMAWLMLSVGKIWLPLSEMTVLGLAVFVVVFYDKIHADDLKIRRLIGSTSGKLHKLALPPSIFQTQDHWQFILRLIDQTLHVNRVILLEKTVGSDHLQEVQALGSDLATIREMRRDYQRAPYSTAIAKHGLTEVENYLSGGDPQEKQFVLPLLLNGEVLGFLAFGVLEAQWQHFYQQQDTIAPMAEQIASLLYQRRLWLEQENNKKAPFQGWFEYGNATSFKKLTQAVGMMERRMTILEQTFTHASHAAIVYDLFGRVLLANQPMRQRLAHSGISLNTLTATDFVARLSGKSLDAARVAMQDLIVNGNRFSWPVNLPDLLDDHLMLRATVLEHDVGPTNPHHSSHPMPFNISGVLVEVMDMGELVLQHDAKSEVRMQAAHFLHEELEKLPALLRALSHQKLNASMSKLIISVLQEKARSIQAIMEKSRLLLEDQASNQVLCYPVDVAAVLRQTLAHHAPDLSKKNLHVELQLSIAQSHAFALPKDLRFCFSAILQMLIIDASSDSVLHIGGSLQGQTLQFQFTNAGFGISDQRLQYSLNDPLGREQSPMFAAAFEAINTVAAWDGQLVFHSEIGVGMQAALSLAAFRWHSDEDQLLQDLEQPGPAQAASQIPAQVRRPRLVAG
jgi:hypothetical protein